jgi:hypothetical protein
MIAVLPGIDINDMNKFILTFQFLSNMLNFMVVCDCSQAVYLRNDLTPHESDLCVETQKFEDFIHLLLDKIFTYINYLANDTSSDESAAISPNDPKHTIKTLINQSSKSFLKVNFVNFNFLKFDN